jgi:hypothetical protein
MSYNDKFSDDAIMNLTARLAGGIARAVETPKVVPTMVDILAWQSVAMQAEHAARIEFTPEDWQRYLRLKEQLAKECAAACELAMAKEKSGSN